MEERGNALYCLRKQKIINEIKTYRMLKEKGIHPFEVLHEMIEAITDIIEIGVRKKYPDINEYDMKLKVREVFELNHQKRRKKGFNNTKAEEEVLKRLLENN